LALNKNFDNFLNEYRTLIDKIEKEETKAEKELKSFKFPDFSKDFKVYSAKFIEFCGKFMTAYGDSLLQNKTLIQLKNEEFESNITIVNLKDSNFYDLLKSFSKEIIKLDSFMLAKINSLFLANYEKDLIKTPLNIAICSEKDNAFLKIILEKSEEIFYKKDLKSDSTIYLLSVLARLIKSNEYINKFESIIKDSLKSELEEQNINYLIKDLFSRNGYLDYSVKILSDIDLLNKAEDVDDNLSKLIISKFLLVATEIFNRSKTETRVKLALGHSIKILCNKFLPYCLVIDLVMPKGVFAINGWDYFSKNQDDIKRYFDNLKTTINDNDLFSDKFNSKNFSNMDFSEFLIKYKKLLMSELQLDKLNNMPLSINLNKIKLFGSDIEDRIKDAYLMNKSFNLLNLRICSLPEFYNEILISNNLLNIKTPFKIKDNYEGYEKYLENIHEIFLNNIKAEIETYSNNFKKIDNDNNFIDFLKVDFLIFIQKMKFIFKSTKNLNLNIKSLKNIFLPKISKFFNEIDKIILKSIDSENIVLISDNKFVLNLYHGDSIELVSKETEKALFDLYVDKFDFDSFDSKFKALDNKDKTEEYTNYVNYFKTVEFRINNFDKQTIDLFLINYENLLKKIASETNNNEALKEQILLLSIPAINRATVNHDSNTLFINLINKLDQFTFKKFNFGNLNALKQDTILDNLSTITNITSYTDSPLADNTSFFNNLKRVEEILGEKVLKKLVDLANVFLNMDVYLMNFLNEKKLKDKYSLDMYSIDDEKNNCGFDMKNDSFYMKVAVRDYEKKSDFLKLKIIDSYKTFSSLKFSNFLNDFNLKDVEKNIDKDKILNNVLYFKSVIYRVKQAVIKDKFPFEESIYVKIKDLIAEEIKELTEENLLNFEKFSMVNKYLLNKFNNENDFISFLDNPSSLFEKIEFKDLILKFKLVDDNLVFNFEQIKTVTVEKNINGKKSKLFLGYGSSSFLYKLDYENTHLQRAENSVTPENDYLIFNFLRIFFWNELKEQYKNLFENAIPTILIQKELSEKYEINMVENSKIDFYKNFKKLYENKLLDLNFNILTENKSFFYQTLKKMAIEYYADDSLFIEAYSKIIDKKEHVILKSNDFKLSFNKEGIFFESYKLNNFEKNQIKITLNNKENILNNPYYYLSIYLRVINYVKLKEKPNQKELNAIFKDINNLTKEVIEAVNDLNPSAVTKSSPVKVSATASTISKELSSALDGLKNAYSNYCDSYNDNQNKVTNLKKCKKSYETFRTRLSDINKSKEITSIGLSKELEDLQTEFKEKAKTNKFGIKEDVAKNYNLIQPLMNEIILEVEKLMK
jgi:hypothetical protein